MQSDTSVVGGALVVGVDFGTLSGRAVAARIAHGAEPGAAVHPYRHGVLTEALPSGVRLNADWALQVPGDYIDVLRIAVPAAVSAAGVDPARVIGIGTDFTACTMLPTDEAGMPLSEVASFADSPHSATKHAAVAAGAYPDVPAAAARMGRVRADVYRPNDPEAAVYDALYAEYTRRHGYFGPGQNPVMRTLRAIRRAVSAELGPVDGVDGRHHVNSIAHGLAVAPLVEGSPQ
jgi:ribulose kinase